MFSPPDFTTSA